MLVNDRRCNRQILWQKLRLFVPPRPKVRLCSPKGNLRILPKSAGKNLIFQKNLISKKYVFFSISCLFAPKGGRCPFSRFAESLNYAINVYFFLQTYRDYHADIYPETYGLEAGMGPENWLKGQNYPTPKMNLDPKKRPKETLTVFHAEGPLSERPRLRDVPKGQENGSNGHSANGSSNGNHSNGDSEVRDD